MISQNKKLSHGGRYFWCLQNLTLGLVVAISCASFATAAYQIEGQLHFMLLHVIWSIGMPGIVFFFVLISLLSVKYVNNNNKKILYSGDYDKLVTLLFDSGFQLQSKIDNFYQFTSHIPLVRSHALLVIKEEAQYSIFGGEAIITAISKDLAPDALEAEVINAHADIEKHKGDNNFKGLFARTEAANNQKNITTKPEEVENSRN